MLKTLLALAALAVAGVAAENEDVITSAELGKAEQLEMQYNKTYYVRAPFSASPPTGVKYLCVMQQKPYFQHGEAEIGLGWSRVSGANQDSVAFCSQSFTSQTRSGSSTCLEQGGQHQCSVDYSQQFKTLPAGVCFNAVAVAPQPNSQNPILSFGARIDTSEQYRNTTVPPVRAAVKFQWGLANEENGTVACAEIVNKTDMFPVPSPDDYASIKYVKASLDVGGNPGNFSFAGWVPTLVKQVSGSTDEPVNLKISVPKVTWRDGDKTADATVRLAATTQALVDSAASFLVKADKFGTQAVTGASVVSGPGSTGGGGGGGGNGGVIAGVVVALLVLGGAAAFFVYRKKQQEAAAAGGTGYVAQQDAEAGSYSAPAQAGVY